MLLCARSVLSGAPRDLHWSTHVGAQGSVCRGGHQGVGRNARKGNKVRACRSSNWDARRGSMCSEMHRENGRRGGQQGARGGSKRHACSRSGRRGLGGHHRVLSIGFVAFFYFVAWSDLSEVNSRNVQNEPKESKSGLPP